MTDSRNAAKEKKTIKSSGFIPQAFHIMAKPTGAKCNLDCDYCFFLKKENLYPNGTFRMSDEVLESYIKQTIEAHKVPVVTIAWQGGEPTMMGLDFFRRAVEFEKKYSGKNLEIENTIQTNGTLIDEEWCKFLKKNNFLVGLSLDGPRRLHDKYRKDKKGNSVFDKVIKAVRLMRKYEVEFNILCTINSENSKYPLEVYRFFRDELKAKYIQFIPIVERDNETGNQEGTKVTERSVQPKQFGQFLNDIFDEWVTRDVGEMFIQFFDGVLASWLRGYSTLCILRPSCGDGFALEHNGDLYSCDHFVEPKHLLGNITEIPLIDLVSSQKQRDFGRAKSLTLPKQCKECKYLFTCHGECPKNRVLKTADGEPGLNWLCEGLKAFFTHTQKKMQTMSNLLNMGRTAVDIMLPPDERDKK
ncbi:MAG: anaerobic sulfatase maturase [Candidatus Eremiobacteraeota bacterium]|nr:anaerobic sulfatase maturase [Candidatus Eremiobacteraeota bacterium]